MSYAIFTVYYGVPLYSDDHEVRSDLIDEFIECEPPGLHTHYTGGGTITPAAIGVGLDTFDECEHHVELADLTLTPTQEQIDEFKRYWDQLEPEVQNEITDKYGQPRVFFLVSSS